MKHFFASVILLLSFQYLSSQTLYSYFPNDNNEFISSKNINWAAEDDNVYSFENSNKITDKNIYDYILSGIKRKTIIPYKSAWMYGDAANPYDFLNKPSYLQLSDAEKSKIDFKLYNDSLKSIRIHEILYLENYRLKSHIVSGSPQHMVVTDLGINLGPGGNFESCFNSIYQPTNAKKDEIIFIKEIERELNFEEPCNEIVIKETYGMGLVLALWYGVIKKKIKLFDIKTNKEVQAKDVMAYPIVDSIPSIPYDINGNIIDRFKVAGAPVLHYLKNSVQFKEKIYYNKTRNYFEAIINEAFLVVRYPNFGINKKEMEEKRFRLVF